MLSVSQELRPTFGSCQVFTNSALKHKRPSFDLDELLANSPPWPPVPVQSYRDDEKEVGSGEWVDKVMVNKEDGSQVENTLGCWSTNSGHLTDGFYQKYLQDGSKTFPEQTYNMFMGSNGFDHTNTDDVDELDAATSDSSEPDLLWQFNHAKLNGITNGIASKTNRSTSKPRKNPGIRYGQFSVLSLLA